MSEKTQNMQQLSPDPDQHHHEVVPDCIDQGREHHRRAGEISGLARRQQVIGVSLPKAPWEKAE